uniref:Uncharacterized protein n=1 Tax=Anguilla anguilla TaxID=7936 RepID=A0A0E9VUL6_ANGAN
MHCTHLQFYMDPRFKWFHRRCIVRHPVVQLQIQRSHQNHCTVFKTNKIHSNVAYELSKEH